MAKEYIDRENYCDSVCKCDKEYCDKTRCNIWRAPAADVAEVRHGEWVPITNGLKGWKCSLCDEHIYVQPESNLQRYKYPYCPNCGAKMDGKSGECE
jgi:hypothetical protein